MKAKEMFPYDGSDGKFRFAILIREEHANYGYYHVMAEFVKFYESGKVRNCSGRFSDEAQSSDFHNLTVYSQGNDDDLSRDGGRRLYGFEVRFAETRVTLENVKRMHQTLSHIQKGMDRLDLKFGRADGYAQYLARICDVLEISSSVWTTDIAAGSSYDDCTWRMADISDMVYRVDSWIYAWAHPKSEADAV